MHQLYFVATPYDTGDTPIGVSYDVEETLISEGFTNDGFFSSGRADWFEIGGRWKYDIPAYLKYGCSIEEEVNKIAGKEADDKTHNKVYEAITSSLGKVDTSFRLTPELLEFLQKEYGDCEVYSPEDYNECLISDLQITEEYPHCITVVDYHT